MSALLKARENFTQMIALFLRAAYVRGERPVLDYVKRCEDCPVGKVNSVHKLGLAADVHLYDSMGNYLGSGAEAEKRHSALHGLWDTMGGADRIQGDLNHYSLPWGGMR